MKSVNELLVEMNRLSMTSKDKCENEIPAQKTMDTLWLIMKAAFGAQWKHPLSAQETWATILCGITPQMMVKGIRRMRDKGTIYVPSAFEFHTLCLPSPEDYGLLDEDEALQQAVGNRTVKAPEVIHTLRQMGNDAYRLRNEYKGKNPEQTIRNIWNKWYSETLALIAHGGKLDLPPLELEETYTPASKDSEIAKKAILDWKEMFDE